MSTPRRVIERVSFLLRQLLLTKLAIGLLTLPTFRSHGRGTLLAERRARARSARIGTLRDGDREDVRIGADRRRPVTRRRARRHRRRGARRGPQAATARPLPTCSSRAGSGSTGSRRVRRPTVAADDEVAVLPPVSGGARERRRPADPACDVARRAAPATRRAAVARRRRVLRSTCRPRPRRSRPRRDHPGERRQ